MFKKLIPEKVKNLWRRFYKSKIGFFTTALILPTSLKKVAIYVSFYSILQPLSGMLFPRAEKVLRDEGINPAVVEELAPGKKIYVRQGDSFLAKLDATLDSNMPWTIFHFYTRIRENGSVGGYTLNKVLPLGLDRLIWGSNAPCRIYMQPKRAYRKEDIGYLRSFFEKSVQGWVNPDMPTIQDNYDRALLHEIRHCSDSNLHAGNAFLREADADEYSIDAYARERQDPSLRGYFHHLQALSSSSPSHDVALYLDARARGVPVPTVSEIKQANKEAEAYYKPFLYLRMATLWGQCAARANTPAHPDCTLPKNKLSSDLARRRLKLYQQALDYFLTPAPQAPQKAKKARGPGTS